MLVAVGFAVSLLGIIAALWVNIRIVKSKIARWDSSSTILFAMSLGNFGEKQRQMWQRRAGYSEQEARLIIKYQSLCLLEVPIGFFLSVIFESVVLRPS